VTLSHGGWTIAFGGGQTLELRVKRLWGCSRAANSIIPTR